MKKFLILIFTTIVFSQIFDDRDKFIRPSIKPVKPTVKPGAFRKEWVSLTIEEKAALIREHKKRLEMALGRKL